MLVRRFLVPCFILFIFLFLFSCVFAYVWTLACVAFITQWRKPCDQPLKYYMLMHFLAWCVMQVISPKLLEFFPGWQDCRLFACSCSQSVYFRTSFITFSVP